MNYTIGRTYRSLSGIEGVLVCYDGSRATLLTKQGYARGLEMPLIPCTQAPRHKAPRVEVGQALHDTVHAALRAVAVQHGHDAVVFQHGGQAFTAQSLLNGLSDGSSDILPFLDAVGVAAQRIMVAEVKRRKPDVQPYVIER